MGGLRYCKYRTGTALLTAKFTLRLPEYSRQAPRPPRLPQEWVKKTGFSGLGYNADDRHDTVIETTELRCRRVNNLRRFDEQAIHIQGKLNRVRRPSVKTKVRVVARKFTATTVSFQRLLIDTPGGLS